MHSNFKIKFFTFLIFLIFLNLLFISCKNKLLNKNQNKNNFKWSLYLANSVISNYDSLIKINRSWNYETVLLGTSIDKLGFFDSKYSKYFEDYITFFVSKEDNEFLNAIDNYKKIAAAKSLLILYKRTGNEKYLLLVKKFLKKIDISSKKSLITNKPYSDIAETENIVIAPLLAQYAKEFNESEWFDIIAFYISYIYEKNYDSKSGLLIDACYKKNTEEYDYKDTHNTKAIKCKPIGIFLMSVIDMLEYFPENHPKYQDIIKIVNNTCESLLKIYNENKHMWNVIIDNQTNKNNIPDFSCSAMIIYSFIKGAKNKYIPDKYLSVGNHAFNSLTKKFFEYDKHGYPIIKFSTSTNYDINTNQRSSKKTKNIYFDANSLAFIILSAIELNK